MNIVRKFNKAINTLLNDGYSVFLTKTTNYLFFLYNHYFFPILPFAIVKIWFLKRKKLNLNELFDISFSVLGGLIQPMQIKAEFVELLKILEVAKPKVIVEIGTANGGTLFLLTKVAPDNATIISIDLPRGEFGGGYPRWKVPLYKSFRRKKQNIFLIRASSHSQKTLKKVRTILNSDPIDFLLIDGNHTYEGVKKDFSLYSSLVRKGGIIAFHDIVFHPFHPDCQVDKFWTEIKDKYKTQEIISLQNQTWAGIGILFV